MARASTVDEAEPADVDDHEDAEPVEDEPAGEPDDGGARGRSSGSSVRAPRAVESGAGWILGLLLWGWVVLPFVKGGPAGVKAVLRAKFLNQGADGSELP